MQRFLWFGKGACLAALQRCQAAIVCYQRALTLDPYFAEAWYHKAQAEKQAGCPQAAGLVRMIGV